MQNPQERTSPGRLRIRDNGQQTAVVDSSASKGQLRRRRPVTVKVFSRHLSVKLLQCSIQQILNLSTLLAALTLGPVSALVLVYGVISSSSFAAIGSPASDHKAYSLVGFAD